jgi:hypothetical protein
MRPRAERRANGRSLEGVECSPRHKLANGRGKSAISANAICNREDNEEQVCGLPARRTDRWGRIEAETALPAVLAGNLSKVVASWI